jgi:hypothetical protein
LKKLRRPYFENKPAVVVHSCNPGRQKEDDLCPRLAQTKVQDYLKNKLQAKGLGVWIK